MSLSVATLAGWPVGNSALLSPANGTPTDAATYSYTAGSSLYVEDVGNVSSYTPGSTVYVAGFLDRPGGVPSEIFSADNGSGSRPARTLPTLSSITLVDETGSTIQEMGSTSSYTAPGGFIVVLTPSPGGSDDGVYPLGYVGPVGWTAQGGAYSNANAATGYPQPIMNFHLTLHALLIIASTQYG